MINSIGSMAAKLPRLWIQISSGELVLGVYTVPNLHHKDKAAEGDVHGLTFNEK